jgi:hypothetical protein
MMYDPGRGGGAAISETPCALRFRERASRTCRFLPPALPGRNLLRRSGVDGLPRVVDQTCFRYIGILPSADRDLIA